MINFHPWYSLTEDQILSEIGKRLKEIRLNLDMSQKKLGELIGKAPDEISRIESGKPITLKSFLRILRALDKLENLDTAIQTPGISPIEMMKMEEKKRKRASKKSK
ncbi:MAG: helix-turn-helix transcriptional regulator [Bacteroidales bacterium]|nr:helix-turn-helix transcriptional regulator [Bacteroidales bacterium]